uniref:von Willebrand factor A domain-containing protein 7-like n=1 Tax=Crassostrea virginica TaxID=6565 RepID=A0A8B8AB57_CRAVI|nr:von Willebrand factor A domain-containing protein 7-like [Crassostrea virginica]
MSFVCGILLILYSTGTVSCFPANDIVGEPRTKSHSYITLEAIYKTTATFLERLQIANDTKQSPSLKVSTFFGSDGDSLQKFLSTIAEINNRMNEVKRDKAFESQYNVNGERIIEAHLLIKRFRNNVKTLSGNKRNIKNKLLPIRANIANILYIIQEFYSNTNWIELHGSTIYKDFGQDIDELEVDIASTKENTCTNCEYVNGVERCENNIIGTKLTSGYKSGQDVSKPLKQGNDGKCSHGTRDDVSKNFTAVGGIYKGRSIQTEAPHSYLHEAAAAAAVKATEYYLIDQERGLHQLMGEETFRDVFSIRTREDIIKTSLTFVIDVTGSMGDDINGVKTATKNIVNEAKDSAFVPKNYILVTFSDPASLTTGRETSDPYTMLDWLDEIIVSGGDDCPEYAMTGLLKGIEMSNNNSKIYVLTDADAKDEHLRDEVTNGIRRKNLEPVFIITGQCSRKKRDVSQHSEEHTNFHREKRSSISVFEKIARETGGKVYEIKVAEVEIIVEKEIKETFPSSNVFVTWFELPMGPLTNTKEIPVDGYIKTLRIAVQPVRSKSDVALFSPNGTVVSFEEKHEQRELSRDMLTLLIKNPEEGEWRLANNGANAVSVNVTAQSALDFSSSILEISTGGESYQLSGNPITGNGYSVVVDIQNLNKNSTCSDIVLLDDNGNDVMEIPVDRIPSMWIARYTGHFVANNKSSVIQIRGTDDQGNPILRTRYMSIMPVSVQLHIVPLFGDLRLYEASNISFLLTNTGDVSVQFVVTISNGTADVSIQKGNLDGKEIYNGLVTITPNSLETQLLNFHVTLENYTGTIQSETRRYYVSDARNADCTVIEYPMMCPIESLNTGNCSSYKWTAFVEVSSGTIRESKIKVSTDEVVIDHHNLTDANFSVEISISGHCCTESFVISIIDKNSYFDQCRFVLSNQPLTVVRIPMTNIQTTEKEPTPTQGDDPPVLQMALGFGFLGIILLGLLIFIICIKMRSRQSVQEETANCQKLNTYEKVVK